MSKNAIFYDLVGAKLFCGHVLTLKVPVRTSADDVLILLFFRENKA